jgi:ABC-type bacteriocin/lantibiotic exporter with double-glycine peptidase domain
MIIPVKYKWVRLFLQQEAVMGAAWIAAVLLQHIATIVLLLSIGRWFDLQYASAGSGKSRALELLGITVGQTTQHFFVFFFSVLLAMFALTMAGKWLGQALSARWHRLLQRKLLSLQVAAPQEVFAARPVHQHLFPYTHDMKTLRRLLLKGWLGFVKDVLLLMLALLLLFRLQATVTAWLCAGLAAVVLLYRLCSLVLRQHIADGRSQRSAMLRFISRSLHKMETESSSRVLHGFDKRVARRQSAESRQQAALALLEALPPFLLYALLGMLLLGMTLIPAWQQTDVLSYVLLLLYLFPVLRGLVKVQQVWMTGGMALASLEKEISFFAGKQPGEKKDKHFPGKDVTSLGITATNL